jgi:transcriptional regulator with XRE-family HTH domain
MNPVRMAAPAVATGIQPRDPSPAELGRRIKMLRVARGLTLKDLEERGGISATHVSEIERGKASPTVGALGRIARALDLRPAALVEPKLLPEVSVVRARDRARLSVQWGQARLEAASEPIEAGLLSMHVVTLPISREPSLVHHHEGEEWAMLLEGVAEIAIDGERFLLREGDAIHFRAHRMHAYVNLGSIPARLLVAGRPRLAL